MRSQLTRAAAILAAVLLGSLPSLSAQPHSYVLPREVALTLLGSYELLRPTSSGATELHVTIVNGKPRLRIGEVENQLVAEGTALETSDGVKTANFKFTVVGKPGLLVNFKVSRGKVTSLLYSEEFAKPPLMITGLPKK